MDEPRERTNPDTCQHRVIALVHAEEPESLGFCISCDATLDPEWVAESHWDYDIDYNVWIWQKPCDCAPEPTPEPTPEEKDLHSRRVERAQARADSRIR